MDNVIVETGSNFSLVISQLLAQRANLIAKCQKGWKDLAGWAGVDINYSFEEQCLHGDPAVWDAIESVDEMINALKGEISRA